MDRIKARVLTTFIAITPTVCNLGQTYTNSSVLSSQESVYAKTSLPCADTQLNLCGPAPWSRLGKSPRKRVEARQKMSDPAARSRLTVLR